MPTKCYVQEGHHQPLLTNANEVFIKNHVQVMGDECGVPASTADKEPGDCETK